MSDIVERLRQAAEHMAERYGTEETDFLYNSAADEITRLRALYCIPEGYAIGDDATVTLAVECAYLKDRAEAAEKLVGELAEDLEACLELLRDRDLSLPLYTHARRCLTRARQKGESDG